MFHESASVTGSNPGDDALRFRGVLGQEIPTNPYTPKRTESLFLKPAALPKPTAAPKVSEFSKLFLFVQYQEFIWSKFSKCSHSFNNYNLLWTKLWFAFKDPIETHKIPYFNSVQHFFDIFITTDQF